MTIWVILLRALGTTFAVAGILYYASVIPANRAINSDSVIMSYIYTGVGNLALIVLCFAAAAALKHQQKLDRKLNALGNALKQSQTRKSLQNFDFTSPQRPYPDLAPVAPNWSDLPTAIPFVGLMDKRLGQQKRHIGNDLGALYHSEQNARNIRVGVPTVRDAPEPIRQTPGTEAQYGEPPSLARTQPARPIANPSNPYNRMVNAAPDRDIRRMARDAEIRRLQQEQEEDRD